jgi:hypothetical protein
MAGNRRWTDDENQTLREHFPNIASPKIADVLRDKARAVNVRHTGSGSEDDARSRKWDAAEARRNSGRGWRPTSDWVVLGCAAWG